MESSREAQQHCARGATRGSTRGFARRDNHFVVARLSYNPPMSIFRFLSPPKAADAASEQNGANGSMSRWTHAYLLTPLASILVFLVVMSLILWSLNRREQLQQEDVLYRNVAWAQQQIRLSLNEIQEQFASLARDIEDGRVDADSIGPAVAVIARRHPEVLAARWTDARDATPWSAFYTPAHDTHVRQPSANLLNAALDSARAEARQNRRQSFAPLSYDEVGNAFLTLHTPISDEHGTRGMLSTVISAEGLLLTQLPRELSGKYKISLVNGSGREIASSSSRPRLARDVYSQLALDPPGNGIVVRAYGYPNVGNLTNNTLLWLVLGLSCFVLWSLYSLWQHTRKRLDAQKALYAETTFRRAMENSVLIGMRVLDMEGRITHVNPAFCRMTGWDESDLVGTLPPYAYWPHDNYPQMRRQIDMTLRGRAPASGFELRVGRKDGTVFHARMYVSPLVDSSGRQTGWMSSMTDITEPRRIREELSAAQERFTTVLESLDAAVSVLASNEAELLFANRYYRHLFGVRPDGHLQLTGAAFDAEQASSDSIDLVDTYAGLPANALTEAQTDTKEVYLESCQKWFEVRRQYIQWVDGHVAQMQIATDITSRKEAQELARQQEEKLQFTSRLTTMGEMASSLAHELNQPLAAISNYCSGAAALVRSERATPETLLGALEKTAQQAVRAGMIIKRIREFVKRSEPKRQPARVPDIVADAIGLAEIEAHKRGIRIVTELSNRLPPVMVDPVLIEQVLVNLLKNAAEAMHTGRPASAEAVITVRMSVEAGAVRVTVIDHGPGVDEKTAERLFEPFYSTKPDGMGMGLNICRSIIESHRGRLWVANNVNEKGEVTGCSFSFTLPANDHAGSPGQPMALASTHP